ncbi:hypothetical protein NM688_g2451 [Phlebia brevispora]|uniref:Uncharacterized protein n=1 Tax=Phlebia brevispora TaxID=194682 RepID=A0ACC1T8S4_9APHY|nr:hypothetical protein NM688_g2451 [Phlebia brevispora]
MDNRPGGLDFSQPEESMAIANILWTSCSSSMTTCALTLHQTARSLTVVRQSPITLPLAKVINATGATNIISNDRARIKALREGPPFEVSSTRVDYGYVTSVGFGTPPTYYDLIVDTGSSVTWTGANPDKPYVITPSSVDTGFTAVLLYGSGFAIGEQYNDTVTLGPIAIHNQGIVAANNGTGFAGFDGVLGLGPVDLTSGTTTSGEEIPTVEDNAFQQGLIPARVIAVSFEPTDTAPVTNGEITFGSIDTAKFIPPITYVPLTTTSPASLYWGIDQSVTYRGETILIETAGIVDTGTTFLYLASDAYSRYQNVTAATVEESTGLLYVSKDQYGRLADLVFNIGGTKFALTPNAQIWPRALNSALQGADPNKIYLAVGDLGLPTGTGFDFVDGMVFLERFYSVFDTGHNRVGLANTVFTKAVVN